MSSNVNNVSSRGDDPCDKMLRRCREAMSTPAHERPERSTRETDQGARPYALPDLREVASSKLNFQLHL